MKTVLPFLLLCIVIATACTKTKAPEQKKDRLYFVTVKASSKNDTTYIDKPEWIDSSRKLISRVSFCNVDPFCGEVTKYDNQPAPTDGTAVTYQTNDLGIIYTLNTTWKSYKKLHSTNDSIERRINEYMDHILSRSEFVAEGDIPLKYFEEIVKKNEIH
ncbi:MAG TPA: hypothetical protein VFF27_04990 [Bacteroidia bacterium]|jgi:hypothetical protein|nr:hypothetical protein [Bacteroidia bacterium]